MVPRIASTTSAIAMVERYFKTQLKLPEVINNRIHYETACEIRSANRFHRTTGVEEGLGSIEHDSKVREGLYF